MSFVTVARFTRSAAIAAAALLLCGLPTAGAQAQVVPAVPTVEGPITGPGPMHPGIRPGPEGTNLEDFDYLDEEYFVSGCTIPSGSTVCSVPYKTRLLIRKPANPQKFSGMVVGEPTHRGGNALICQYARYGIGQRGHACMTVAARRINLTNPATAGAGLYEFNLERYGSLQVTDAQTNQIIAQVGRLLRENPVGGPMGEYAVRTLILGGTSDSSGATRTYMSSNTQLDHADLRMPDGGPIYQGFFVTSTLGNAIVPITDVPTIQMPSQSEVHDQSSAMQGGVLVGVQYRRPDSDVPGNQFRIYEVAAMSHNDARENPAFFDCAHPLSHFPHGALTFMGLQHVLDWAGHGTIPPRAAYMETSTVLANGTRVALDQFGNAKGGVRSTYLDVPIFTFHIPNSGPGLCSQTGWPSRLPQDVLDALYGNYGQYVSKIEHRLKELMDEGWFPKEYASDYVQKDLKAYKE
jgi:hypothetical protein